MTDEQHWLPEGWTLERVRLVAKAPDATWGDSTFAVGWEGDAQPVEVETLLLFGQYAIALEAETKTWAMGGVDGVTVTLWSDYGDDLEAALVSL